MTNSRIFSTSTTSDISYKNEERDVLFIHEFKITNHNYRSTILSTCPSKSSNTPTFLSTYPPKSSNKYWMRYSLHISMIFSLKLAHILKMKFESEARWSLLSLLKSSNTPISITKLIQL